MSPLMIFSILSFGFVGVGCLMIDHPVYNDTDENINKQPRNEYEYFRLRDSLLDEEMYMEGRIFYLTQEEEIVNDYFGFLKWQEMLDSKMTGFLPSKPIEKVMEQIKKSNVYKVLVKLPKGGNVHSHEDNQLSRRTLFEIIWNSDDFAHLYMVDPSSNSKLSWKLDFFINPPTDEKWIKIKGSKYTMEDLVKKNTLMGLLTEDDTNSPTDAEKRWVKITPLWDRSSSQLTSNMKIYRKQLEAILEHSISEGVTYIEARKKFGVDMELYELDYTGRSNKTFGKKFIDPDSTKEVELTMEVTRQFIKKHPSFIDFKRISCTTRTQDYKSFESHMNRAVDLHKKYPKHVIGFDVVSGEDNGRSNLYYISQYLSLQKDGYKTIPLYLHSTETNWPDDLISGSFDDDPVPALQNAYEAILLKSRRIGHGKGFIKKPFLVEMLKKQKTAVEVCITSNQILGMEPDLRNHYGQMLYKQDIPIILAPDDPGTFGYDGHTFDWYSAYMAWGLNLGDLKELAINSLTYNGMTREEREIAIKEKWLPSWEAYMDEIAAEVCKRNFTQEAIDNNRTVSFIRSYPNAGTSFTKIHIYGRNFERAICKKPKCKVGKNIVFAKYISNQHLTCLLPGGPQGSTITSQIEVDLDGLGMVPTNFRFQYLKPPRILSSASKFYISWVALSFVLILRVL